MDQPQEKNDCFVVVAITAIPLTYEYQIEMEQNRLIELLPHWFPPRTHTLIFI